jgi:solute carrier family 25 (mitochondrial phosphate transporter), member 3
MFQTSIKYGTYEVFKDIVLPKVVSDDIYQKYPGLVYVTAAACAEGVADIFMCPWEMLKVKVQTAGSGVALNTAAAVSASSSFPTSSTFAGLRHMIQNRKEYNFPFGSLGPLWFRQIPGTIMNFYTFENISQFIYNRILAPRYHQQQQYQSISESQRKLSKEDFSLGTQLSVTVISGYVAGFVSSVISHPADSLVSLMSQPKYKQASIWQIVKDVGFVRLATNGLGPRIIVTGQIICFQWFLYDIFKNLILGSNNKKVM